MIRGLVGTQFVAIMAVSSIGLAQQAVDSATTDTLAPRLLPAVIVTGTVVPMPQSQLGFASAVLNRKDLESEPTAYAGRALARTAGIWLDEGAGPGGPTVLRLRGGEEPYTQLLFDGVPININGGFLDLQGLTLTNVERVEVALGPHSALYGSSAISGVVQLLTRQGRPGAPRFELSAEGGRATQQGGQARSELDVAGGTGILRYSAGVGVTYNRGVYDLPHDLRSEDASVRLDVTPSTTWSLTGTFRFMDLDSKLPVRDAGATRAPLDPNQRDERQRFLSSLDVGFAPGASWRHRLTASAFRDDFSYEDRHDGLDPSQFSFFVFDFNFGLRSVLDREILEYVATKAFQAGGARFAWSYGGELQWEDVTDDQTGDFGDSRTTFARTNRAGFTEFHAQLAPGVSFLGGGRLEHVQGLSTEFLPRAAITVSLVPQLLSLRAAAGRAFKAPNLQQQFLENPFTEPNPDLRPETSTSWELGAQVRPSSGRSLIGVGYFRQGHDNLIRTVALEGTTKQTNQNLGRTRSQGLEVELERRWTDRWNTGANLTWLKTEVVDNAGLPADQYPVGEPLPAVPSVTGNAFVDVAVSPALSATFRGMVVGRQVVFSERFAGQRTRLDPYALLGMTLRWQTSSHAQFHLRVENLLNTQYAAAVDRPGLPLTAVLGARLTS